MSVQPAASQSAKVVDVRQSSQVPLRLLLEPAEVVAAGGAAVVVGCCATVVVFCAAVVVGLADEVDVSDRR
jgi:hypothetical protein